MTVLEFTKLDMQGVMFAVVDANKTGFMSSPSILIEADKNVVRKNYGDREVIGFSLLGKTKMMLYTK